jgi:hypothetical protein
MKNIFAFCKQRLATEGAYKGKNFTALLSLADAASKPHPTMLEESSEKLSDNNRGETAFQRELYKARNAILNLDGTDDEITWNDLELPVTGDEPNFHVKRPNNAAPRRPNRRMIGIFGRAGV